MRIYQSLFILKNIYNTITYLSDIMVDHHLTFLDPGTADEKTGSHFMALFQHSILEACSFMEEYEQNFGILTEPAYQDRIRFVKKAAKPVVKKIKAWSDLQTIRNEILAHPWRGKGNTFSFAKIFTYKSPRNFWELQTL